MDNETLFFVLGGILVLVAVVVSFAGLRFQNLPGTRALLVGGTLAIAVLVGATMTFAWRNAEDEQEHREAELAEDVAANEEAGQTTEADEEAGSDVSEEAAEGGDTTASSTTSTTTASVDGAQVFTSAGCSGCHTLADAGSDATTGPVLDSALKGKSPEFIRESIIDPNAEIEEGFAPNIMPETYEQQLSPEELDALVSYLSESTGGSG